MNWIDLLWSMATGACLTMALIHLWIGLRVSRIDLRVRRGKANLVFALNAFLIAFYSRIEWWLIQANNPAEYLARLRWQDINGGLVGVALVMFVWVYLGTGRKWLAISGISLMLLSLTADFGPKPKLVFLELTSIRKVPTFGGATYTVAEGVHNPWNIVFYLAVFLMMLFVADASISHWRWRGRRRATIVGVAVVLFITMAGIHSALVDVGIVKTSYFVTFFWMFILGAMAWNLSSERLDAEKLADELRVNQERLNRAAAAANLIFWEWDIPQDKVWVNEEGLKLIGSREPLRRDMEGFLEFVHPDDRETVRRAATHAVDHGGNLDVECRVVAPNGQPRWIATRGEVVPGDHGGSRHLRGVSLDISERKQAELALQQSESRLKEAQRMARVGNWEWDIKADRVTWSDETYRIYGLEPGTPLTYSRLMEIVHPEDREYHDAVTAEWMRNRGGDPYEYRILRPDGQVSYIYAIGEVECDAAGVPVRFVGTLQDITQRKNEEAEKVRLRNDLARFSRMMQINELSASLAHEINQPLGAILNNAAAAKKLVSRSGKEEKEIGQIVEDIIRDADRAGRIVRGIRDMAKKDDLKYEWLSVNDMIREIMGFVQLTLREQKISAVLDLQHGLPRIKGNRIGLQQVMINLISNARDAMRDSPTMELRVSSRATSPDEVTVRVGDSGTGIQESVKGKVFEPLITTKKEGMGLGLPISRSIVEEHGGRIWIENNPDAGATVCFSIPVHRGGEG